MGGQGHVPAVLPLTSKPRTRCAGGLLKDIQGHYELWPVHKLWCPPLYKRYASVALELFHILPVLILRLI